MKFQKTYEPTIDGKDFPEEMQKLHQKKSFLLAEEEAAAAAAAAAASSAAAEEEAEDESMADDSSSSSSLLPPPPLPPQPPPPPSLSASNHKLSFDEVLSSKKQMNQRYLCVVCRDEFKAVSALRSHMEMRHPDFVSRPTNGAKPCVSIIQSSKNKS